MLTCVIQYWFVNILDSFSEWNKPLVKTYTCINMLLQYQILDDVNTKIVVSNIFCYSLYVLKQVTFKRKI